MGKRSLEAEEVQGIPSHHLSCPLCFPHEELALGKENKNPVHKNPSSDVPLGQQSPAIASPPLNVSISLIPALHSCTFVPFLIAGKAQGYSEQTMRHLNAFQVLQIAAGYFLNNLICTFLNN